MARPTVRILSRYLLRQHLAPLGFALAAFTLLMLLRQVAQQFGNLVGKGLPWSVILEVFLLSVPFIIAMTLPMAVLVAVLYAFSQLAGDHEITAMKASGVSLGRLVAPVLSAAALVAALAFLWSDQVLPRSNHRLRTLLVDIQRKKPSFSLKERVSNEVVERQFFLRAARIDPATNRLRDVTIYDLGDPERRRIISADSGRMAYTPGGRDLYLTLLDGDIREVNRSDPTQFDRTLYVVNKIRVQNVGNSLERTENDSYKSDREMGICEMRGVVAAARREAEQARRDTRLLIDNDRRRLAGLVPALRRTPARGELRGGDPQEVRDRRRVHRVRPGRHSRGAALSAGRRGARAGHEPDRVHGVLRRPDRRRGAGRPAVRVPVLRDVDAQPLVQRARARGPVGGPAAGGRAAGRRLDRPVPHVPAAPPRRRVMPAPPAPRLLPTLDRYVVREWLKVFLITVLGFPLLVIVIDLTDNLGKYLSKGLTKHAVADRKSVG